MSEARRIRAYWDGERLSSRLGNRFFAPDWFIEDLPADTLDGELWVGRKKFSEDDQHVRARARAGQEWRQVSYVVSMRRTRRLGFEERLAHARKVLERAAAPHARCARARQVRGQDHLREELIAGRSARRRGFDATAAGLEVHQRVRLDLAAQRSRRSTTQARVIDHAPGTGAQGPAPAP
jgi:DNA ligase-1